MAFALGFINELTSLLWGNTNKDSALSLNPKMAFSEILSEFTALSLNQEECIKLCITKIEARIQQEDDPFSESGQHLIQSLREDFHYALAANRHLTSEEAKSLESAFNCSLRKIVEERWALERARSFDSVLSISNVDEKMTAARQWTSSYFEGVDYFLKWEGSSFIYPEFVAELAAKTSVALHAHAHTVIENKMKTMLAQAEKNPWGFAKRMETVEVKVENEPTSFFVQDSEGAEFAQMAAHTVLNYWPEVDEKLKLMKQCIWHGYTLKKFNFPIEDSSHSRYLIGNVFKTK